MSSNTRETRIIAACACPRCGVGIGEKCRNPVPHREYVSDGTPCDPVTGVRRDIVAYRGPEDRRRQPLRCHAERRRMWSLRAHGV